MGFLDLARKLSRHFVEPRINGALESLYLVVLVAILQRQGFELALRQIGPSLKIQFNDFVGRGDPFFFQVFLEGSHVARIHTKNIQGFQAFKVGTFGPLGRCAALERVIPTFQTNTTTEQLDDLRAFALPHVQQTHGGNPPTAPAFSEFAGANQHVQLTVLVVQCAEHRPAEIIRFRVKQRQVFGLFGFLEKACIVTDVDQAERLRLTHPKHQFALAVFEIDHLQPLLGIGIEQELQDAAVHIIRTKRHQRGETVMENIATLAVQQACRVSQQILQPQLGFGFIVQEPRKETQHVQDV